MRDGHFYYHHHWTDRRQQGDNMRKPSLNSKVCLTFRFLFLTLRSPFLWKYYLPMFSSYLFQYWFLGKGSKWNLAYGLFFTSNDFLVEFWFHDLIETLKFEHKVTSKLSSVVLEKSFIRTFYTNTDHKSYTNDLIVWAYNLQWK